MKNKYKGILSVSVLLLVEASGAHAQSTVTLYGILDEFVGYQSSTVGGVHQNLVVLGNNGELTSRFGIKGSEDLGGGYRTTFQLENGFDPSSGKQQNSYRLFDRQAWVGVASPYGEVRFGRQNTPMFAWSGNLDALNAATYGSGYNNFSNWLARVDNDIAYLSPKLGTTQIELHYSVGGQADSLAGNAVYQAGGQSILGPFYLAAAYVNAANLANTNRVQQIMAGGNWTYGPGKVYFGYFRSNEVISATTGNALSNPAGKYDPTGGVVGNTPGNWHSTFSISADYQMSSSLGFGVDYAYNKDSSGLGNNAQEYSAIVNYDISKRTRIYGVASRLMNSGTAQFKMTGASVTTGSFLTPGAGQDETGVQIGIRHTF